MRKRNVYFASLVVLLLSTMCNILHATTPPSAAVPQQQQTTSGKTSSADDHDDSAPAEKLSLSDELIQQVLEPLRTGIETQNAQLVLSIFDKRELSGYSDLQGQLRAFFRQYAEVRFRYQILQATADADHAFATAEIDMDAAPYNVTTISARRSVQMRFELKRESKGWKITRFNPSDFFSLDYANPGAR